MGHLVTLCIFLSFSYPISLARYTTEPDFGSGEGDGTTIISNTQGYDIVGATTENSMKNVNGTNTALNVFENLKQFLNEYMLLVIVVGTLVALLIFIMCAAVIMSHRHKASAYYPSSFAPKEYVNHDDKNGGPSAFNEIPEKPHDSKAEDVVSSSNQLQADILSAAQNLRSPTKGGSMKEQKHCEAPQKTCDVAHQENPQNTTCDKPSEIPQTQEETPGNKVEEAPAVTPEEAKPTVDSQEAPAEPTEETKPKSDCQEGQANTTQEVQPAGESQEPPVEAKADVPAAQEEIGGKEDMNPNPNECGTANNNPCECQEPQQPPDTNPCGV